MCLVSVLTTSFNRAEFIGEAIESVLASTYSDFEYIIVDDASADRTFEVIQSYANKDSRIKAYQNTHNLGDYPNRKRAASYATGKYIKYLDSDDVIYPHGLEAMVSAMEKYPQAGFGLCAGASAAAPYPVCLSPKDAFEFNFSDTDIFGRSPASAIIKREAFEEAGGFTGKRQIGDFELWLNLACTNQVVVLPAYLVWCRLHAEQEQNVNSAREKFDMKFEIWKQVVARPDFPLSKIEGSEILKNIERRFRVDQTRSKVTGFAKRLLGFKK